MRFFKKISAVLPTLVLVGTVGIFSIPLAGGFGDAAGASGTTTFFVPSGSMWPTIKVGTDVVASPLTASATIKRGEIIIFTAPSKAQHVCGGSGVLTLIKRVIGVPGDHLTSMGNTILLNGKPLKQQWTNTEPLGAGIKSVTVASGHYFVMGDNQPDSCDSRLWGTVRRSNIHYKVLRVLSSKPPTTTTTEPTPLLACQGDGATLSVAIAAFDATNPGVTPTEALLTGSTNGGPFLSQWPQGAPSYAFSISPKGVLQVAIPATAAATVYKGPASCDPLK